MTINTPISLQVISFLALDAAKQVRLIQSEIPNYRGCPGGPIELLVNAIQTSAGYFFDHFPGDNDESLLHELRHLSQAVATRDSRQDFLVGKEWQRLRVLAQEVLQSSSVVPIEVSGPVPLRSWVCDHYVH